MQHYFRPFSYKSVFGLVFDNKSQGNMQTTEDSIICETKPAALLAHE